MRAVAARAHAVSGRATTQVTQVHLVTGTRTLHKQPQTELLTNIHMHSKQVLFQ